ncbi:Membrane protein insertase YidC, partial [termite gut metagenome]
MNMDKNTVTGLVLIGILLIGFSFLNRPSQEQIEASRHHNDSIALSQQKEEALKAKAVAALVNEKEEAKRDSNSLFLYALQGNEEFTTIENTVIKLTFTNKGGQIYAALLKNYKGQDKEPLILFDNREVFMNFYFYNLKEIIQTKDYYFERVNKTDTCVTMRLTADSESYIDFIYQLRKNNYMVDFTIKAVGMENKLASSTNYVDIEWKQRARQQEKGYMYENRLSDLTYKLVGEGTDNLSQSRNEEKTLNEQLDWIAYKNQFFSSVFISEHNFNKNHLS